MSENQKASINAESTELIYHTVCFGEQHRGDTASECAGHLNLAGNTHTYT